MDKVFHPYDVKLTEDDEIIAFFEPDEELKEIISSDTGCWEIDINILYDNEKEEPILLITIIKGNKRLEIGLPYGDGWEALENRGLLTIALVNLEDYEYAEFDASITLTLEIDDYYKGFISGASQMWEEITEEAEN